MRDREQDQGYKVKRRGKLSVLRLPESDRPTITPEEVQHRLKQLQKRRGLTDDAIAAKLGIGKLTWRRSILGLDSGRDRGKQFASLLELLIAVRQEFGVKWVELLGSDED